MTWGNTITLWCDSDDCEKWGRFQARKVGRARNMAESDGWDTTRGGPDYCPRCAETGESSDTETDRSGEPMTDGGHVVEDVERFDDGAGKFMAEPDAPELVELDEPAVVDPTEWWDRHRIETVNAVEAGLRFLHGVDDSLVATVIDPANVLAIQTQFGADVETPFWTRIGGPSYETLVETLEELVPPLAFDPDGETLHYRAAADSHELGLMHGEYHRETVPECPVESRDEYATAVVPGWRIAGGFTLAAKQAEANGRHSVDVYSDGETLAVEASPDGVDEPEPLTLATGEFHTFRSTYSRNYLATIAGAVSENDHLLRVDDEVPLLLDDGDTKYALAPRVRLDDEDGGTA